MIRTTLTATEREVLFALTHRIRVTTKAQLRRTWWSETRSASDKAANTMGSLERAGLVISVQLRVRPELPLEQPIWFWTPGNPTPPFGAVSYRLRTRWTQALTVVTVYSASAKAARLYAGHGGPLAHPLQVTHDLHMAAIYFRLLRLNPTEAEGWVSEDMLAASRRGQKLPDAEIHDANGRPLKVIEFGGSYPPERVQMVHEDCERRHLPYELW